MKLRSALLVATFVAVLGACSSSTATPSPDPNAAFCSSLKDVAVAVADYQRLGPDDSIDAYKAATQNVVTATQAAVDARKNLGDAKVDALASSVTTLKAYLQDLPQDVPVAQLQAEVQVQLKTIAAERLSLGVVVCKQPAPPSEAPAASVAASAAPASPAAS